MAVDEVVIDIVEQFGLLVRLGTFAPYIVEEYGKRAYAESVHHFEFVDEVVAVFVVPLDVNARMDGPVEVDTIQPCHLVELLNAVGLVGRVGLAPLVAMIGVSFGP